MKWLMYARVRLCCKGSKSLRSKLCPTIGTPSASIAGLICRTSSHPNSTEVEIKIRHFFNFIDNAINMVKLKSRKIADSSCLKVQYYRPHIISWRFRDQIFLTDGVAISRDITNYGYDVDFWFKRQMLDLLSPKLLIYLLSQMHSVPKYIYTKPLTNS